MKHIHHKKNIRIHGFENSGNVIINCISLMYKLLIFGKTIVFVHYTNIISTLLSIHIFLHTIIKI